MPLARIAELPAECAQALDCPGAIVIGVNETGDIVVHFHGIESHMQAVEKLAVAIHAVMGEHDKAVLAGKAGRAAQRRFQAYEDQRERGQPTAAVLTERFSTLIRMLNPEHGWMPLNTRREDWVTPRNTYVRLYSEPHHLRGTDIRRVALHGFGQQVRRDLEAQGIEIVEVGEL